MEPDQFDRLITAIVTAGYLASKPAMPAKAAGKRYLMVEQALRDAGVVTITTGVAEDE